MPRRPPTFALAACAAAFVLALLAGCGGGRIGKQGDVRLVNVTSDYGALDLYADDARIATGVGNESAGGYAGVDAGTRTLSLRLNGSGAQLAAATAEVAKDAHVAVLAYTSAGAAATVVLAEDETAPSDGSAKVRVFNAAAAEAGALSAYLSPLGCSALGTSNAVATGATAASAWKTVGAAAAGTSYHLCVTASGDTGDLRLDLPSFTLSSRQVTTVVLTATPGGVLVNALVVDQQGQTTAQHNPSARLRLVADAAGGATVSATVNGTALANAVASPSVGTYFAVPAGALTADLRIGGLPLATSTLQGAAAGADMTLLVAGSAAAPTVVLFTDDNRLPSSTSLPSRLRLLHGVNGLAAALSLSADLLPVASSVGFAGVSPPVNVAGLASASIQVTAAGAGTPFPTLTAASTLRTGVYTLFVLGDAAAPVTVLRPDRLTAGAAVTTPIPTPTITAASSSPSASR